jgi:hypothetical protein
MQQGHDGSSCWTFTSIFNLLIPFMKCGQYFVVNPNLRKMMDGLGHSSDDDMHLICLSINREINQWQTRSKIISIWFFKIETHWYRCGYCIIKKHIRWCIQPICVHSHWPKYGCNTQSRKNCTINH